MKLEESLIEISSTQSHLPLILNFIDIKKTEKFNISIFSKLFQQLNSLTEASQHLNEIYLLGLIYFIGLK